MSNGERIPRIRDVALEDKQINKTNINKCGMKYLNVAGHGAVYT
jgi:hypothetical protein